MWRTSRPNEHNDQPVFPDAVDSIWSYDEEAGPYYLHHFYSNSPNLNIANPDVREEIARLAGFWLELRVDGFRVDAVLFLFETGGISGDVDHDPHQMLKDPRAYDFRPTLERIREKMWNEAGPLLTGQMFGVGRAVNLGAVKRLLAP